MNGVYIRPWQECPCELSCISAADSDQEHDSACYFNLLSRLFTTWEFLLNKHAHEMSSLSGVLGYKGADTQEGDAACNKWELRDE